MATLQNILESSSIKDLDDLEKEINEFEKGVYDLGKLIEVFERGDFKPLIGKSGNYTTEDIIRIDKAIRSIYFQSPFIDHNQMAKGSTWESKIEIFANMVPHAIEMALSIAIAGGLAGLAFTTGPIGSALAVAGAGVFAGLGVRQAIFIRNIKAMSRLLRIMDRVSRLSSDRITKKTPLSRFVNFIKKKDKETIQKEMERTNKKIYRENRSKLKKLMKNLPEEVEYIDYSGNRATIQTFMLFSPNRIYL